jgi:hypothetical protein
MNFNNALSLGPGTNLELTKLEGIDMPAVRSGDAGRPRDHGSFAGLDVMGEREITVAADLHNKPGATFSEAWEEVAQATVPGGSIQYPLFLCTPVWGTLATLVRVRKRSMPVDITFTLGNLARVMFLFAGTDPRWYAPAQVLTAKPASVGGFSFPFSFSFSFGGGSVAGLLSVNNAGYIETRPVLTVEGPCVNPAITNVAAPGAPTLAFTLTLGAGERLVIDTDLHTAKVYSAGSTVGSTRLGSLVAGSKWWTLNPGVSLLQFLAGSGEGTLSCEWASAYII